MIASGFDSTPESNLIPQLEEGEMPMANRPNRLWNRVLEALSFPLKLVRKLRSRTEVKGVGIHLLPGLLTLNVGLRAGGSGRGH